MGSIFKTKLGACFLAVMVTGCTTQNEEQNLSDSESGSDENVSAYTSLTVKKEQTKVPPSIEKQQAMKTLLINAGKYQLQSETLIPGSKVKDLQLQENAVVTNKIVVVVNSQMSTQAVVTPELIKSRIDGNPLVKKLASSVFEISFSDSTTDMYKQYQTLLSLDGVSKVELQLKYGPRDQRAEY